MRFQSRQRYLEEQLQLLRVFSPIDGIVTTHKPDKTGQAVKQRELIAKVHAIQIVTAEKVVIKARAYPHTGAG